MVTRGRALDAVRGGSSSRPFPFANDSCHFLGRFPRCPRSSAFPFRASTLAHRRPPTQSRAPGATTAAMSSAYAPAVAPREIPGRGVGLIATRDIAAGECVLRERAIVCGTFGLLVGVKPTADRVAVSRGKVRRKRLANQATQAADTEHERSIIHRSIRFGHGRILLEHRKHRVYLRTPRKAWSEKQVPEVCALSLRVCCWTPCTISPRAMMSAKSLSTNR